MLCFYFSFIYSVAIYHYIFCLYSSSLLVVLISMFAGTVCIKRARHKYNICTFGIYIINKLLFEVLYIREEHLLMCAWYIRVNAPYLHWLPGGTANEQFTVAPVHYLMCCPYARIYSHNKQFAINHSARHVYKK